MNSKERRRGYALRHREPTAVLVFCQARGLTEVEADAVWDLVRTTLPGSPSAAYRQLVQAIAEVRDTPETCPPCPRD